MDPTLEQIVAATKASLKANATLIDEAKCHVYGQFLHRMNQAEANGLYWSCFIFNIMLLIIVACLYTSSIKRQKAFEIAFHVSTWHPEISERDIEGLRRSHRRSEHWLLFASFVAASVMIPVIIIEALAGLNINFCHKQDLIMFYWGPFFLLSVGTLIATWGLFLSQSIENEPAWNVALGTPVLVFAALGHWAHVFVRYSWRQMRDKEKKVVHPSLAPRDLCPRYLPICLHCQTDSNFPTRTMSRAISQASSQYRLVLNAAPVETSALSVPDSIVEQPTSREMQAVAGPSIPEINVSNHTSERNSSEERPSIRFAEPASR